MESQGAALTPTMTESEIDREILRHDARNLQLKRRLAELGIDFRGRRYITCNFRAPSQAQGRQLERELIEKGFQVLDMSPAGCTTKSIWHVRAGIESTIDLAASHDFTEMVVHCAAGSLCIYDGWCTCI